MELSSAARPVPAPPSRTRVVLLFVALGFVTLLASLSQHLFVPALPLMVAELDAGSSSSWVIVAFILASIPMMPIFGKLSDVFGRRALLLVAVALFTAGSLVGAFAPDMGWLIVGRVLQGAGSGGLVILPQAAIADVVPARQRGRYSGILSAVFAASSVAGPFVGGLLAQGPGWRWGFWINLPLGVLAGLGVLLLLRIPRPASSRRVVVDIAGMVLISVITVALALVTTWGGVVHPWNSPIIIGIAAAGLLALIAFPLVERRVPSPVLPLLLFRDRTFVVTGLASMGIAVVMFSFLGYLPTFVQAQLGASPSAAGLAMIPMAIGSLLASTASGQIVARTGRYKLVLVISALVVAVAPATLAALPDDPTLTTAAVAGGVVGLGLGGCFSNIVIVVQNAFPHAIVGVATAATSLFRQVGGMFGTALVGALFLQGLSMQSAYLLMVPVALAAAAALLLVPAVPLGETIEPLAPEPVSPEPVPPERAPVR
ncbi:MFS transporter [Herbiconiux daphne]|uniref:MFS transporter n=1 Tax=Herbiconiux daphne TaxID=2970914 RepID=A0ABT2H822_9MICO|nr:MFS transporter [Herbiconiux daphne]MCS5736079.1 MFS transporter [Herbiconiux daphne]